MKSVNPKTMKKLLIPIIIIAIVVALYEQSKADKNIWVMIVAVVIFMFGMMRLSAKIPSKNQDKNEDDVQ